MGVVFSFRFHRYGSVTGALGWENKCLATPEVQHQVQAAMVWDWLSVTRRPRNRTNNSRQLRIRLPHQRISCRRNSCMNRTTHRTDTKVKKIITIIKKPTGFLRHISTAEILKNSWKLLSHRLNTIAQQGIADWNPRTGVDNFEKKTIRKKLCKVIFNNRVCSTIFNKKKVTERVCI